MKSEVGSQPWEREVRLSNFKPFPLNGSIPLTFSDGLIPVCLISVRGMIVRGMEDMVYRRSRPLSECFGLRDH